jgi:ribonuclease HII
MENYFNINNIEIGLDEAGRGPLIGNVYAGAVIWDNDLNPPDGLIIDSKKLSSKKRKIALEWIKQNVKNYSVGYATNEEIDNINILEATKLAMQRAIDGLLIKTDHLIIDGTGWEKKFTNYKVKSIVKGDSKYYSIAAASILAKEYHDDHILNLCSLDNSLIDKYSLNKNMGYASKKHIDGIKLNGYTSYHRKSFKLKCITN